jgi:hypothetical protein
VHITPDPAPEDRKPPASAAFAPLLEFDDLAIVFFIILEIFFLG